MMTFLHTAALAALFLATAAHADPLRLGVLTDMASGNSDSAGAGSVEAARMAVEDAGGTVAGRPVEIVFADHQGKPDVGAAVAREWLSRDGVAAIVDVPQSAVALAVMPLVEQSDRVALLSGAGAASISGRACSPNTVQWTFDTFSIANATARALLAENGSKWFFVSADYTFGQDLERDASAAVRAGGGQVVGAVRAPFNTNDFSSYLLTASTSGANVVAFANVAADTRNSIMQAHEFGLDRGANGGGTKLAGLLVDVNDVRAIGLPSAQGLYAVEPFYWDRTDASRAWSQRFQARTGRMPSTIQAGVYSAVRAYLLAVAATGSDKGSVVVPQMRRTPVHDMFAENGTLRPDGLMVHDMFLMRAKPPGESHGPWDVFQVVRTIAPDDAFRPLSQSECPRLPH